MSLSHFQHSHMNSLSLCVFLSSLSSSLPTSPPPCSLSAPGLWFGWGMWLDARMDGWIPRSLSPFSNLRTQLPGETTMTPPPHTQPAHRGPPAGDMLHKAVTTAVSKVSQYRNGHAHACTFVTHAHTLV